MTRAPHLVIMAAGTGGHIMPGLAVAREMRPHTPFIFVSGTLGEEYAIRALQTDGHRCGVVKPAFGSSGRGFRRTQLWSPEDDIWADSMIEAQGALVVEPWLERLADFSVQAEAMGDGTIHLKGLTRLLTDERGRFLGVEASGRFAKLFSPEIARFFCGAGNGAWVEDYYLTHVFPHLASRFAQCHFRGAFGLDALVYRAADGTRSASGCSSRAPTTRLRET